MSFVIGLAALVAASVFWKMDPWLQPYISAVMWLVLAGLCFRLGIFVDGMIDDLSHRAPRRRAGVRDFVLAVLGH